MKISQQYQTKTHKHNENCTVQEYLLNDEHMDAAVATISGRYPETRRVVNQACRELVYVIEGKGNIVVDDIDYPLTAGDVILIDAVKNITGKVI